MPAGPAIGQPANGQPADDGLAGLVTAARRDARGEGFDPGAARMTVSVLADDGTVLAEGLAPGQVTEAVQRLGPPAGGAVVRLRATCVVPKPGLPGLAEAGRPLADARTGRRSILLPDGRSEVPVYARDRLQAGHAMTGPCLIESGGSTCLVPAGMTCQIDHFGTAVLARGA
jgi:N-methylhydantoinase A/oxoprolinase/acetone carboxylase beta subunit